MKAPLAVGLLIALTGAVPQPGLQPPPSGTTLRIDQIRGGNEDGSINVQSFTWGAATRSAPTGPGGRARAEFEDLTVTIVLDKATPELADAVSTGRHYQRATLSVGKGDGERPSPDEKVSIELSDVQVTSFKWSATGATQQGQLTLSYAKIEWVWGAARTSYDVRGARPR